MPSQLLDMLPIIPTASQEVCQGAQVQRRSTAGCTACCARARWTPAPLAQLCRYLVAATDTLGAQGDIWESFEQCASCRHLGPDLTGSDERRHLLGQPRQLRGKLRGCRQRNRSESLREEVTGPDGEPGSVRLQACLLETLRRVEYSSDRQM